MKTYHIKTMYYTGKVKIIKMKYAEDNSIALQLVDAEDGEPVARATVCLRHSALAPNEVLLRGWSENEGLPEELERLGIVGPVKRFIPTGFVEATVHDLLGEP